MASEYLERKYINQLSFTLQRFHWKGNTVSFRCPFCGDSKKSTSKTRGYIYRTKKAGSSSFYAFKCFNCHESMMFGTFLERLNASLYQEYKLEIMRERSGDNILSEPIKLPVKKVVVKPVKTQKLATALNAISVNHPAHTYYTSRLLPEKFKAEILVADNFQDYVLNDFLTNSVKYAEYADMKLPKDKRLIFVYRDRDGKAFAIQGRSLVDNATLRYITIRKDDEVPKIYGLDRHDKDKLTLITEGPIDSLFLPNALAIGGAGLNESMLSYIGTPKDKIVMLYDNEPRNKTIVRHIENAIDFGVNVVILKEMPTTIKDVNKMILSGYSRKTLLELIVKNIYRGEAARLELNAWKRTR